ncbi:MAG TPA: hemerythrin domain-containing protein [Kofleriaceae bacterium]|nr:hemerythrin domain-containing protein [Kofleriaceae bacterium]
MSRPTENEKPRTQSRYTAVRADAPRRPDGLVGVFATLAEQHAQVAAMFAQIQGEPARRAALWPALRRQLVSHEHAEVRELYPQLRQYSQTAAFAEQHDAEARMLDGLIQRLDTTPPASAEWGAVFEQLVTTVLHHAKDEEEQQIFPAAQQVLGEAMAIELDAKLRDAQAKLALAH